MEFNQELTINGIIQTYVCSTDIKVGDEFHALSGINQCTSVEEDYIVADEDTPEGTIRFLKTECFKIVRPLNA